MCTSPGMSESSASGSNDDYDTRKRKYFNNLDKTGHKALQNTQENLAKISNIVKL